MVNRSNIMIIFIVLALLFVSSGCDSFIDTKGKPVSLTQQDTLDFLVNNSDLIAIAFISDGTDKARVTFFNSMPKKVNATITSIIKGEEERKEIEISYTPKYIAPNVIKSSIVLRNGKHLVFLSKTGEYYQPTTGFSLLDIFKNRVYPIWRPDQYKESEDSPNGEKISSGIELQEVLTKIKLAIYKR